MEDRIQKAVELFKSGYNCSQSVVAAFADMYGFTQEQAVRMSASFGGGISARSPDLPLRAVFPGGNTQKCGQGLLSRKAFEDLGHIQGGDGVLRGRL